ncbi:MAG TPA: putative porin [Candidatus Omnitrophota bacterium]|nr:putative porin [Candidatus Omnitrophota bacterium]
MKKNSILKALSLALATVFSLTSTVFAQDANLTKLVEQLQQQMSSMQQTITSQNAKIASLEGRGASAHIPAPKSEGMTEEKFKKALEKELGKDYKTFKNLKFSGDIRLRYEAFDHTSGNASETDPRNRFRYRLRTGLEKKFNDEWKAGFGLASSEATPDNVSTNTTLDNNFTYKDIYIEKVYATYTPNWAKKGAVENLEITGGKFKNPFEKGSSDMIWDRDVTPEGLYQSVDFRILDTESIKATGWFTAGQFILDEDSATKGGTADAELYAYQFGINPKFKVPGMEKPLGWTSAVSWYDYSDYAVDTNFGTLARGNANATGPAAQLDAKDFGVIEFYNELNIPVLGTPVRPYFDVARNMSHKSGLGSAPGQDMAWALGLTIGKAKKKGEWEIGYAYKNIEANSVVGAFNDSDFGTTGHSDKRGSVFKGKYMFTDFLEFGAAGIFTNGISNLVRDEESRRFQIDLVWKW